MADVTTEMRTRLQGFVNYRLNHLAGDEKGEAQVFCDRLFQAFGHDGVREAGATLEYRLRKDDDRGTSFADLMFKPRCLVEMKKAKVDLSRHFRQAFDYWIRAVPDRPRYVVLCNFDEFWVYDFDRQLDEPVDRLRIEDLPRRWEALGFLTPQDHAPVFGNDLVEVTAEAAEQVATVFLSMHDRGVARETAQRFVLQSVVAMFSESIGLLPTHSFSQALADVDDGRDAYDLVFGLFRAMNEKGVTPGGRFVGTPYFNGGLFASILPVELTQRELESLREASQTNWAAVRPEIFGTLFENSMDATQRHAQGAHFTSQAEIMRVVGPTIVSPWREQLEEAKSIGELENFLLDLQSFRVLDPACGSGNFLYVAYREMRRIENDAIEKIASRRRGGAKAQTRISFVTPDNFLGIDINAFAVEVAKVTLLLGKKLAADELGDSQSVLPLDNLDRTIRAVDALFTPWPKVDAIIGNPPYLGRRKMVSELGAEYCAKLATDYPHIGGVSDFVTYWFPLAHDRLDQGGRAGFVATKTVRQGDTRRVSLDYVVDHGGLIVEAIDSIPWAGDAAVTVSIVNWVKGIDPGDHRILWTDEGSTRLELPSISSALSAEVDLRRAESLECNIRPKRVHQGQTLGVTDAFELSMSKATELRRDKGSCQYVHPLLGGNSLLKRTNVPSYVLDLPHDDASDAWSEARKAMEHIEAIALPERQQKAEEQRQSNAERLRENPKVRVNTHHQKFLDYWWRLGWRRTEMLEAIGEIDRYIAITRTSSEKRGPVFTFLDSSIRISDSAVGFDFDDDYSFGVLQSRVHELWFRARCTTLETRLTYTSKTVFDSFPWPQDPSPTRARAVTEAAAAIIEHRAKALAAGESLARQYDVLRRPGRAKLRQLHEELDQAVIDAYGFKGHLDLLTQLLSLNLEMSSSQAREEPVTPPGPVGDFCRVSDWRLKPPSI